jgi:hypothetical protein
MKAKYKIKSKARNYEKLGEKLKEYDQREHISRRNTLLLALLKEKRDSDALRSANRLYITKNMLKIKKPGKTAMFLRRIEMEDTNLMKQRRIRREIWKRFSSRITVKNVNQNIMMKELTNVKLINTDFVHYVETHQKLLCFSERIQLKIKLKEQDEALLRLFKKKVKICLEKTIKLETKEACKAKKVGKTTHWEREVEDDEEIIKQGESLEMRVEIYVRRVKWKKKRTQSMHRKTVWKGKQFMFILKETHLNDNPDMKFDLKLDRWKENTMKESLFNEMYYSNRGRKPKVCEAIIK